MNKSEIEIVCRIVKLHENDNRFKSNYSLYLYQMELEYKRLLEKTKFQRKENKAFFEKLKKIPGRQLDELTQEFHEQAFKQIDCLKCANCCKTTGPYLKNKDIQVLSEQLRMKPLEFTKEYLRVDEDHDFVFKSMPCPFLKDDNHCSVYSARPNACREYPHTDQRDIRSVLAITYLNTMICPAVAVVVDKLKIALKK